MKDYPNVKFYGPVSIKEGVVIEEGTGIGENCVIGAHAKIGRNCKILYHVTICKDAIIEDDVFIGPNTTLLNDKYPPTKVSLPPIIEKGAIIGGAVTIGPNVKIGERAVIGCGANVKDSVPPEVVIVTESTQKIIMTRDEYDQKQQELKERYL